MTYTIYVDDTLFLNTVINYFLLLASLLLSRLSFRRIRVLAAAFTASLYSFFALLPSMAPLYIWPLRFLFALLFSLLAVGSHKRTLRAGILFIFLSFLFGGMVSAMTWLTHSSSFLTLSRGVYLPGTLRSAAVISAVLYYIILRFFRLLFPPKEAAIRNVTLANQHEEFSLALLLDTGSHLYDPIRNLPIPIVEKQALKHYFTQEEYSLLSTHHPAEVVTLLSDSPHHFGLLPITTAGGNQLLLTFRTNLRMEETASFHSATVALMEANMSSDNDFDGIIGI